jgi:hypothetical protein
MTASRKFLLAGVVSATLLGCGGSGGSSTAPTCQLPPGGTSLHPTLAVSTPPNGQFFRAGEAPTLTLRVADDCGALLTPDAFTTAWLYVTGPRAPLATRAALGLLNASGDRNAADHQHHFIDLKAPRYASPAAGGLTVGKDGTVTYRLRPVSGEAAGTYSAAVWLEAQAGAEQRWLEVPFQLGTATVEPLASGADGESTCLACHQGAAAGGRVYMHHGEPSATGPLGHFALDSAPVGSCKACHNNDGFSANPAVRKIHAVHRGARQANPGVAHPEYGQAADVSLASYADVVFPSEPAAELDCQKCHVTDAWKASPSRLACGSCHDNVFFDAGTLSPPRTFGRPAAGACAVDDDCAAFGAYATCNTGAGVCQRAAHPVATDDGGCVACHSAAEIAGTHEITSRTEKPGLSLSAITISGATGPGDAFQFGDVPVVSFQLGDANGPISDLVSNNRYSLLAVLAGPDDGTLQRVATNGGKTGLAYGAAVPAHYTFAFPAWPMNAQPPQNRADLAPQANVAGGYLLYLNVFLSFTDSKGALQRDAASWVGTVKFDPAGAAVTARPRQVVSDAACNGCHVELQAHGGSRRLVAGCATCHTAGAEDRAVGSTGLACVSDTGCPGFEGGWEACDGAVHLCKVVADPTPGATIRLSDLAHRVHFARKLEGYAERSNLVGGGRFTLLGFGNVPVTFAGLLPVDVRNCAQCHDDEGTACSSDAQCGYGQSCGGGQCVNTAWKQPSTSACLSCHDSAAATGHAALNTYSGGVGAPIETCTVCHGEQADFSVERAHDVHTGLVPPYLRE